MTLNAVTALILRYFAEFYRLRHCGWIQTYLVCRMSSSTFG